MKKIVLVLLLAAVPACFHAQRILERTNNSWDYPNLSVETYGDQVFAACTDFNPATGLMSPMVKVTDINGFGMNSFYLDLGNEVVLMDFVIRPNVPSLLFTGYLINNPDILFVAETDFMGNMNQTNLHAHPNGWEQIPHQIIVSENFQQVVIVGTELQGPATPNTYATVPKNGFVLGLDLNNQNNILFNVDMDSPGAGWFDSDMLEAIAETPHGYFITGSANDPSSNEQQLFIMGIDPGGTVMFSDIWDDTNSRYAGASVLYASNGKIYLLANNSVIHQYQIMICDANTGAITTNLYSYTPVGFPVGGGIDVNGFRLQEDRQGNIIVGGQITCWNTTILPSLLTPFQVNIDPSLTMALDFKLFQSDNNSPLADYYNMSGNSVYINTPDMIAFNPWVNSSYLVNPNTAQAGYDLNKAAPIKKSPCSVQYLTNQLVRTPAFIGNANHNWVPKNPIFHQQQPIQRAIVEKKLCTKSLLFDEDGTAKAILFPNPAQESITLTSETSLRTIRVIDLNGAIVSTLSGDGHFEWNIDLKALKTGVYILEYEDLNGNLTRERFVKE